MKLIYDSSSFKQWTWKLVFNYFKLPLVKPRVHPPQDFEVGTSPAILAPLPDLTTKKQLPKMLRLLICEIIPYDV